MENVECVWGIIEATVMNGGRAVSLYRFGWEPKRMMDRLRGGSILVDLADMADPIMDKLSQGKLEAFVASA
jgi:hypothetical protein